MKMCDILHVALEKTARESSSRKLDEGQRALMLELRIFATCSLINLALAKFCAGL